MCLHVENEDWTHLDEGSRRARKTHECLECRRAIAPGESYWFQTAVDHYDKSVVTWKMCAHCRALIGVGGWLAGCPENWWWEFVLDTVEEGAGFAGDILSHDLPPGGRFRFLRLLVLAGRKWRDRHGRLVPVPHVEVAA